MKKKIIIAESVDEYHKWCRENNPDPYGVWMASSREKAEEDAIKMENAGIEVEIIDAKLYFNLIFIILNQHFNLYFVKFLLIKCFMTIIHLVKLNLLIHYHNLY